MRQLLVLLNGFLSLLGFTIIGTVLVDWVLDTNFVQMLLLADITLVGMSVYVVIIGLALLYFMNPEKKGAFMNEASHIIKEEVKRRRKADAVQLVAPIATPGIIPVMALVAMVVSSSFSWIIPTAFVAFNIAFNWSISDLLSWAVDVDKAIQKVDKDNSK